MERRNCLGREDGPGGRIAQRDRLVPCGRVPVEEVELDVVRLAVGQVTSTVKLVVAYQAAAIRPVPPASSRALGSVRVGRPGVGQLAAGLDGRIGREAGRVADDLIALCAIRFDPVPFRRSCLAQGTSPWREMTLIVTVAVTGLKSVVSVGVKVTESV